MKTGLVARRREEIRREIDELRNRNSRRRKTREMAMLAGPGIPGLLLILGGGRMVRTVSGGLLPGILMILAGAGLLVVMGVLYYRMDYGRMGVRGIVAFTVVIVLSMLAGQLATGTLLRHLFNW